MAEDTNVQEAPIANEAPQQEPPAQEVQEQETPSQEAPAPKRRGRPRKTEGSTSEAVAETPASGDGEASAAESEAPKRRRGRPRKKEAASEVAQEAPASGDEQPTEAAADNRQLSIEEMTRATQEATQATAVPIGAPATTLAEADAFAELSSFDTFSLHCDS